MTLNDFRVDLAFEASKRYDDLTSIRFSISRVAGPKVLVVALEIEDETTGRIAAVSFHLGPSVRSAVAARDIVDREMEEAYRKLKGLPAP